MGRIITVLLLLLTVAAGAFFLKTPKAANLLNSPIPKVYGTVKQKSFPPNEWFPKQLNFSGSNFSLDSKSAILVDYDTGNIIFEKSSSQRLPAASTIKIMTALVALENAELENEFVVSEKAASVGENSMGLAAGEKACLKRLTLRLNSGFR